ncbi:MAG: DUF366 family protein [Planctomycetota bacterium]
MKTLWSEEREPYDGSQLAAHWILRRHGISGDALVAWRGPCLVPVEQIADLEDVDGPGIRGDDMVHFLWESFGASDLRIAVLRQRLLAARAREALEDLGANQRIRRSGDDLYVGDGKLSISIATVSPVSALIHFAVNARPTGAPVPISSLSEIGVEPTSFARELLDRTAAEEDSAAGAIAKVRARGEWRP